MTQTNTYIERTDAFMANLARAGYEVYRVGGSVRDEILGRKIKDGDYMVRGCDLKELGQALKLAALREPRGAVTPLKLRDGRQAGWRVSARGLGAIEITLPRKEVSTGPGHRDFEIVLDPELTVYQDAERRDFTFNALYKGIEPVGWSSSMVMPDGRALINIVDPTDRGLYDLQHRLISTTHEDSFRDDPLRTLRALRFVSTLGYDLASETEAQMHAHAACVDGLTATGNLSGTVYDEMSKLLMGPDVAKALRLARDTGVLGTLFPELSPMFGFEQDSRYHDMTTDEHTFEAIRVAAACEAPLEVRWALLFHDSGKPETAWMGADDRLHYYEPSDAAWMNVVADSSVSLNEPKPRDHEVVGAEKWELAAARLSGMPKDVRKKVSTLIREHMLTVQPRNAGVKVRRNRVRLGDEMLMMLHMHRMCDLSGKGKTNLGALRCIAQQEDIRRQAEATGAPRSVKDLAINGKDIIGMGVAPGPAVSKILSGVLDEVVCDPSGQKMTREWQLLAAIRQARKAGA